MPAILLSLCMSSSRPVKKRPRKLSSTEYLCPSLPPPLPPRATVLSHLLDIKPKRGTVKTCITLESPPPPAPSRPCKQFPHDAPRNQMRSNIKNKKTGRHATGRKACLCLQMILTSRVTLAPSLPQSFLSTIATDTTMPTTLKRSILFPCLHLQPLH